jgi:DnaJ-domain-containing protein 1
MEARLSGHIPGERERALEDAFFARHDQALLQRLRAADNEKSRRQALAATAGISDEALLDRLMALNLNPGTLVAMAFAPLVLVAWADGALDTREKEAVLAGAREAGLEQHPESRQLLDEWLRKPPPRGLADA